MDGRGLMRALAIILLVLVAAGIGVSLYNAGIAAGVNQAVQQAVESGQPVPTVPYPYGPYGYGPGHGFFGGIFGIFFWIIGFFLIFMLIRAAFGWGRWGGGRWGPGRGGRSEMVADWHRELHRREAAGDVPSGPDRDRSA